MLDGPARLTALLASPTVPVPLFIDVLLACPSYPSPIHRLSTHALSDPLFLPSLSSLIPSLLTRLDSTPTSVFTVAHILRAIADAHVELAALVLEHSETVIPQLSSAYANLHVTPLDKGVIRAKAQVLLLVRRLVRILTGHEGRDAIKRLMGSQRDGITLNNQSLRGDYEVFEGAPIAERELLILRKVDADDLDDPRLGTLRNLFPDIPVHLLVTALRHPQYSTSSSRQTPEQQAAPLIDAILSGGSTLPDDLDQLRDAIRTVPIASPSAHLQNRIERKNIWDDQLDLSRLRLKGQVEPAMGTAIPEHLRASILRLVDAQAEEAEAQRRALAEADGLDPDRDYDDEPVDRPGRVRADADESDAEEGASTSSDSDTPAALAEAGPTTSTRAIQTTLELAYLRTPKIFDRDSATRRSDARKKLRDETGWDDGQLEGWRLMLERNPHKDAILGRHQWEPARDKPKEPNNQHRGANGEGGSQRGGGGGGRGGGGGSGGRGGGGRGRGQNKGSRGHSNAARTRGHDKKMARMGGGA